MSASWQGGKLRGRAHDGATRVPVGRPEARAHHLPAGRREGSPRGKLAARLCVRVRCRGAWSSTGKPVCRPAASEVCIPTCRSLSQPPHRMAPRADYRLYAHQYRYPAARSSVPLAGKKRSFPINQPVGRPYGKHESLQACQPASRPHGRVPGRVSPCAGGSPRSTLPNFLWLKAGGGTIRKMRQVCWCGGRQPAGGPCAADGGDGRIRKVSQSLAARIGR